MSLTRGVCLVMLGLLVRAYGAGQQTDLFTLPGASALKGLTSQTKIPESRTPVPMDAPLVASEYFVGPGDELSVNIWSSPPASHSLTITPEGLLVIPEVGTANVRGLTLEQAKERVVQIVRKRVLSSEVTVSLLTPRKVTVQIIGFVLHEGLHEINAVERVDRLIAKANVFPSDLMTIEEYETKILQMRQAMSERKILVRSRDGSRQQVDLVRYRITGQGKYNPYLREGDVVYVPNRTDLQNSIGVFGGVMSAASFEHVEGDSLSHLVQMAFGFPVGADPVHAVLTRLSRNGRRMDTLHVDARAVVEHRADDIALLPGDRLVIPALPDARLNYRVELKGEVVAPGMYPITRDSTRLTTIIRQAGGFTREANLKGARLIRSAVSPDDPTQQLQNEWLLSRRAGISVEDTSYYGAETRLRLAGETVALDFEKLFLEGDSTNDVVLRTYDKIEVPRRQRSIYVFGQVVHPGHVALEEGRDYMYYIAQAGGFTQDARDGDTRVIKVGSRIWLDPEETVVEDGDYIWVPKEIEYPLAYYASTWVPFAAILSAIATVVLAVEALSTN